MESQPQNPEFRINHENFHTCILKCLLLAISVDDSHEITSFICLKN